MGKPFANELSRLPETEAWAREVNIDNLRSAFERIIDGPIIFVAAGGSFTAADFGRSLVEEKGGVAVTHTPQSFLQSKTRLHRVSVVIFTAGGNNRDITTALQSAQWREAREIVIISVSPGSKVDKMTRDVDQITKFIKKIPSGKDGYLATNSLFAFAIITLRAFGFTVPPELFSDVDIPAEWAAGATRTLYYFGIYGLWGRAAAIDLESKFGEAGLASVTIADLRNFAHGRHNWIDKRGSETTVLAFETPDSKFLLDKTIALLPGTQRIVRFSTNLQGPAGALPLLASVFGYTEIVGQICGIDPGRPKVPEYGGKIYRMGPVGLLTQTKPSSKNLIEDAVERKLSAIEYPASSPFRGLLREQCREFIQTLENQTFGAIVADFDGTVASPGIADSPLDPSVSECLHFLLGQGIPIYFATGRGDSIHSILEKSIPEQLRKNVYVSYYNGAFTLSLLDSRLYNQQVSAEHFLDLEVALKVAKSLTHIGTISNKGHQLTIKVTKTLNSSSAFRLISEFIEKEFPCQFRVVHSSHSIDILPLDRSKSACIVFAESALQSDRSVLAIGDRGALPGNDHALLSHRYSLSVDQVSSDPASCWNLLPRGLRGPEGFCHYVRGIRKVREGFKVKFS